MFLESFDLSRLQNLGGGNVPTMRFVDERRREAKRLPEPRPSSLVFGPLPVRLLIHSSEYGDVLSSEMQRLMSNTAGS